MLMLNSTFRRVKRAMQQRLCTNERGDTLIEVTFALTILSVVLLGSTGVATKAFQLGQHAKERTQLSSEAQQQMEALRSFRDNRTWDGFVLGSSTGAYDYEGVLSAGVDSGCRATPGCFHMELAQTGATTSEYVPVGGTSSGTVAASYIEIVAEPDAASDPDTITFSINYGFEPLGGGPLATGHIKTILSNLTPPTVAVGGPVPPPVGPCTGVPHDIVLALDRSESMDDPWQSTTRRIKLRNTMQSFAVDTMVAPGVNREAVVAFGMNASVRVGLSDTAPPVTNAIRNMGSELGTRYIPPMTAAGNILRGPTARPGVAKVVVLVSDGIDFRESRGSILAAANNLKNSGVTLYTIGINMNAGDTANLRAMASSPAHFADARNESDLDAIATAIAGTLGCP